MSINLPTKLTLLRLALIPPFIGLIVHDHTYSRIAALIIFVVASLTDLYDGKLARKLNVVTTLGKFLDPLADKLLISTALVLFVQIREFYVPAWMVVLIIGREFLITGLRTLAVTYGRVLPAVPAGKFKTTSQITTIIIILIILITNSLLEDFMNIPKGSLVGKEGPWGWLGLILKKGPYWMVGLTTILTVVSGYIYLSNNSDLLKEGAHQR